ncbi:MAG: TaqI-like C-terminal specificity domain-containing protein [Planctomycetia bacterium]
MVINRGILTGLTEVFVIDEIQRKQLLQDDPNSGDLLLPFIQGKHVRPWYVEDSGEYVLAIKSSGDYAWPWSNTGKAAEDIFSQCYPAVYGYLAEHRNKAVSRSDQGRHWWELRSCGYWEFFGKPKIVWPDIGNSPRFSIDSTGRCFGNTVYGASCNDSYVQAILSSWSTWFFVSKTAQPLRLRSNRWQYRLFTQYMSNIPVPDALSADREILSRLAEQCNELGTARYRIEEQVRKRLATTFRADSVGKLNEKSQEWWLLPLVDLGEALKTSFKLKRNPLTNPAVADEWEPYLDGKRAEVESLRGRLADAEAQINDRVFRLFNLTADEIKLLLKEVEH